MTGLLKIRRDERLPAAAALLVMAALNALMMGKYYDLFTRSGNVAYWQVFYGHFTVSGFDSFLYLTISHWKVYYTLYRHPLLPVMLYPLCALNHRLTGLTGVNCAVHIVAVLLVVADVYTFIFVYRILRELVGVRRGDALLLSALFFSFAYVMLACVVPDHFGISMLLLVATLYVAGSKAKAGRQMAPWQTALLFLVTAGVTLTNGLLVLMAAAWCNGRRFFRPRSLIVAVAVPLAVLAAAYLYVDTTVVRPDYRRQQARLEQQLRTDKKFAREYMRQKEWMKTRTESDNTYLRWIDTHTSRWDTAVENLFGESVQLHRDYLLQDTNRTRPIVVRYARIYNYVAEAVLLMLFAAGVWAGRRQRFMLPVVAWFAFNMLLHIAVGFALTEVYIMAAHWAWAVPIAIGCLFTACHGNPRQTTALRTAVIAVTLWLWAWNGTLVYMYMSN